MGNHNDENKFLAIIFSCYNRIDDTKACIDSLRQQLEGISIRYQFYICDDHSTDGTFEMLKDALPKARVIRTEGNYYWSKSMYVAMCAAREDAPDYYLMINDDVVFSENAIAVMLASYHMANICPCGIVGTTVDTDGGKATYGGRSNDNSKIIMPSNPLSICKVANRKCFLIDSETVNDVGSIDGNYEHGGGDYAYCY